MTEKKHDDEYPDKAPEPAPPGPKDRRRRGGMATRENAPEITTAEDAPEPPD
ncbi:hypothetical protein [Nocardia sp. NPDC003345]